jgi:hypothetical protein
LVTIEEIVVGDLPGVWEALGFRVDDGVCRIGSVAVRLGGPGAGRGIVEWTLRGAAGADLDGLPTRRTDSAVTATGGRVEHPNGALQLDHVVVETGDLERTTAAFESAGVQLRRRRDDMPRRMGFFRLGEVILELVESDRSPAAFWGLVVVVDDLDRLAAELGDRLGEIHDAVQPGRRIASLAEHSGVTPAFAFMS